MTEPGLQDFDIGLLRLFLQVVDSGGFTGAQARANLSLSAISSRMAILEQRLGVRLCRRGRGGFALTADGCRVQAAARRLFAAMGEFRASVAAENQLAGEVRVAVGDAFVWLPSLRLHAAVARFQDRPGNAGLLRVGIMSHEQQIQELMADSIDVGFATFAYEPIGLEVRTLFMSRQVLCCARDHALFCRAARAGVKEVAAFPFVMRGDARPRQMPAELAALPAAAQASSAEGRAHLILSGRFLGYLPAAYAAHWIRSRTMRAVNPTRLAYDVPLHMAIRPFARDRPAVAAFIEDVLAAIE